MDTADDGDKGEWLAKWLYSLNLSEYLDNFTGSGLVTSDQIQDIDKTSLKSIGITKLGHVTRLVKAAEKLANVVSDSPASISVVNGSERSTPELSPSVSAPQLTKKPPVPMRRSLRRSASPASSQKQSNLLEATQHADSPERSHSPSPTIENYPRPAPRHKPIGVQYSESSVLEQRRRSSPDILLPAVVLTSTSSNTAATFVKPVAVEVPIPTPRKLASPVRNKKYYENVGRSAMPVEPAVTQPEPPSASPPVTSLPPPPPPRRSSSMRSSSPSESREETEASTLSSQSIQRHVSECVEVPPIPPKIPEEEILQPAIPPKDISLSDLPPPVQPRIASLDSLKKEEAGKEDTVQLQHTQGVVADVPSLVHNETDLSQPQNVLLDSQAPSLPPKSNSPPGFRPPTPPITDDDDEEDEEEEKGQAGGREEEADTNISPVDSELVDSQAPPPPVPPKDILLLPQAPSIPTDITDTEDECDNDDSDNSGEEMPRMVITSTRRESSDILVVSAGADSTVTSPMSPLSPMSTNSSDVEMSLTIFQQKSSSEATDRTIDVAHSSSFTCDFSSHRQSNRMPHYDEVALKTDQAHTLAARPDHMRYENVTPISAISCQSQYDTLENVEQPDGHSHHNSFSLQPNTQQPQYQQVPSPPRSAASGQSVYDHSELADPLSTSNSSYSSHQLATSLDSYSSVEGSIDQTDDTYSTIPNLQKPAPPLAYSHQIKEEDSADLYSSIDDEGMTQLPANVAFSMPDTHMFPPNDGLREHRVPSASTLPSQQPPSKPSVFGCFQSVREHRTPTDVNVYQRSKSTDGILEGVREDQPTSSINPSSSRSGLLEDAPRTKEGYLYKRGGRRSDRPWQKRWVIFKSEELKYYKAKGVKESEALNCIRLKEMIDVKKVTDFDQPHRFDLVIINRVFQFYAESEADCKQWISVLHAAIGRYNPSEDITAQEGGTMHNPDKQGGLLKQGHGKFAGFKQRYVALKGSKFAYYEHKEDFDKGRPIHTLDMRLANVRPDTSGKNRFTITMPSQRSYVFQATSSIERKEWMDSLTTAILKGLNLSPEENEGKKVKSKDILARIQENPANRVCADCTANDPVWGVINRGIMVCIECSGVHRAMGVHVSKVRSVELDQSIWTDSLIELIQTIGNDNANRYWLHHKEGERLPADSPRDIREQFIRSKYESKSWIPRLLGDNETEMSKEDLSKELCDAVTDNNLMRTTELIVAGANVCYVNPESPEPNTPLLIAKAYGQLLQVELLEQNGALVCRTHAEFPAPQSPSNSSPTTATPIFKKGYLHKTGSDRQNWRKRFCKVDTYRGIEYFKSDTDMEVLGVIRVDEMLGVSRTHDDDLLSSSSHKFCFEVITPSRAYLFSADTEDEMISWIDTISQLIPHNAAEKLGYEKVGFLSKKSVSVGWKRMWFALHSKKLSYYKKEREEIASIDLRRMTDFKGPEQGVGYEASCTFSIVLPDRTYQFRADSPVEADSWIMALKHTQVSGIPMSEQQLTTSGIPVIVHKCLQFIEQYGLDVEGLYRKSGEKKTIRNLEQVFNQDARGVYIDPDSYTIHDVTGCLKQFFRSLPDPLLTHNLYHNFLDVCQKYDHETMMQHLKILIEQLPGVNRETLKRMIGHLMTVIAHEADNKMTQSNIVSLFGPTLMTVDGDPMSFADAPGQYACISHMMTYYKWLFQVDEKEEEKREERMEDARRKIEEATQQHRLHSSTNTLSSTIDFLITVFIDNKDGGASGMKVTAHTSAAQVVEFVSTTKSLPPRNYALFLVVGDAESERPLHSAERVLAAQALVSSESFFCLKPNIFADSIESHMATYSGECLHLFVREKRKWKKYPCCVRDGYFIQFKDGKGKERVFQVNVNDVDLFVGIEQAKLDVKNPLPGKYPLCLRARMEDNSRYLCAETSEDRKRFVAAVLKNKYPNDGIQTPIMPIRTVPCDIDARNRGFSVLQRNSSGSSPTSSRKFPLKKSSIPTIDEKVYSELQTTLRKKSPSPQAE